MKEMKVEEQREILGGLNPDCIRGGGLAGPDMESLEEAGIVVTGPPPRVLTD